MSAKTFDVLSIEDMNKIQSPGWLIHEAIPAQSLIQIFGRESHGKTFVALDMGLRIASGLHWAGDRPVRPGKTVFVAGEGIVGLKKRVGAWMRHNAIDASRLHNFWIVPEPVQLAEKTHVSGIIRSIETVTGSRACDFIVFDTQARCTEGVDENSAEEMGIVVKALDWLRLETGAAIMLIHHSPYNIERGRGSSVVPGALDTVIGVAKKGHILTLTCRKQKDWEEFEEFKLGILPAHDSAVVIEVGAVGAEALTAETLTEAEREFLESAGPERTLRTTEARELWKGGKTTFFKSVAKLKALNLLEEVKRGHYRVLSGSSSGSALGKS